jgi:flagellar basal body-associated protein FliL
VTAQVSGRPDNFPPAPQRKNKRLLLVLALVAAVVVLAGIGTAVTLALGGSSTNFAVNDCVKESSGKAVKASCSDSKAYKVINKVSKNTDCADQNQPYVVVEHKGSKDEVLCLRPASQK